jgi:hypothetical protein
MNPDLLYTILDARAFWSPAARAERQKNNQRVAVRFVCLEKKPPAVLEQMRRIFKHHGAIIGPGIKRTGTYQSFYVPPFTQQK